MGIFSALKDEHFKILLPKVTVRQHALVLKLHEENTNKSSEVRFF